MGQTGGADRQSSGLLTDIPVADRDYEGVRNVVGGSDIARGRRVDRKIGDLLTSDGSKLVSQTSLIHGDWSRD